MSKLSNYSKNAYGTARKNGGANYNTAMTFIVEKLERDSRKHSEKNDAFIWTLGVIFHSKIRHSSNENTSS